MISGAQGGNRTRTTFGQGILSPSRLPIPPLALGFYYNVFGQKYVEKALSLQESTKLP